jgi:hypothetical protein
LEERRRKRGREKIGEGKKKKKINWKIIGRVRRTWERGKRGKAKNNNRN